MGVTKQYLRFVPGAAFGLIASAKGGLVTLDDKNLVASATAETVTIWNLKTGEKILQLTNSNLGEITALAICSSTDSLAVGYHNGTIRLYNQTDDGSYASDDSVVFNGHKTAVTCLAFDLEGNRLASGSRDTNIIVWDVINECGLYRLRGHKGPVTSLAFDTARNVLISSAKDTFIKFWDLSVQHCFKTMTDHIMEVWDFVLVKNYLISGTSDSELRVFKLTYKDNSADQTKEVEPRLKKLRMSDEDEPDDTEDSDLIHIERVGSLLRQGQDKVAHVVLSDDQTVFGCHGSDNLVELFMVCSDEEVKKRCQKRAKKERRKSNTQDSDIQAAAAEPTIQEEFRRLKTFKASGKVRQLEMRSGKNGQMVISVSTANNLIERFTLDTKDGKAAEAVRSSSFDMQGHRSDIRALTFSSCNTAIASVSHESLRVWSRSSQHCIRKIDSGYGLCCLFVPGDRHVIVGTKEGAIQIFDLDKAEMSEVVKDAHAKEIWSMSLYPDKKGFVTASADQTVKFWSFEGLASGGWSVIHTRTLQLQEDALAVKLSPDGRLIAVSLLDSTVKVFFVDTLKFFLSLYGHKLPALTLDISYDSTLIVTGSADKNVKIWGLDYGDCHKSIFAHDDNVTSVHFVPNTHYFFTAGKDGMVKQWDADNYQRILNLKGHIGEVWALSVSPNGKFVVSSGHDKTLRLWEKTQEPLVLDDEREQEREEEEAEHLATGERPQANDQDREAGLPSKKTAESEKSAERLMEAIQTYKEYKAECAQSPAGKPPSLPLLMMMYPDVSSAEDFMTASLTKIKSSELEETLLVLPLDYVLNLVEIIETLLKKQIRSEIVVRTFFFLVEIHFGPLSASKTSKSLIRSVRDMVDRQVGELKSAVGFNLAALRHLQNERDEEEKVRALLEATTKFKDKKRRKKQKQRAIQTAIISI